MISDQQVLTATVDLEHNEAFFPILFMKNKLFSSRYKTKS